jgi:hypothetical protein
MNCSKALCSRPSQIQTLRGSFAFHGSFFEGSLVPSSASPPPSVSRVSSPLVSSSGSPLGLSDSPSGTSLFFISLVLFALMLLSGFLRLHNRSQAESKRVSAVCASFAPWMRSQFPDPPCLAPSKNASRCADGFEPGDNRACYRAKYRRQRNPKQAELSGDECTNLLWYLGRWIGHMAQVRDRFQKQRHATTDCRGRCLTRFSMLGYRLWSLTSSPLCCKIFPP